MTIELRRGARLVVMTAAAGWIATAGAAPVGVASPAHPGTEQALRSNPAIPVCQRGVPYVVDGHGSADGCALERQPRCAAGVGYRVDSAGTQDECDAPAGTGSEVGAAYSAVYGDGSYTGRARPTCDGGWDYVARAGRDACRSMVAPGCARGHVLLVAQGPDRCVPTVSCPGAPVQTDVVGDEDRCFLSTPAACATGGQERIDWCKPYGGPYLGCAAGADPLRDLCLVASQGSNGTQYATVPPACAPGTFLTVRKGPDLCRESDITLPACGPGQRPVVLPGLDGCIEALEPRKMAPELQPPRR